MSKPIMFEGIYDMFIFNWWQLAETNDLTWLLMDRNAFVSSGKKVKGRIETKLNQRKKIISNQFFNEIALNSDTEVYILKLYKLQEIRTEFILTGDRSLETEYLVLLKQIEGKEKLAKLSAKDNYEEKGLLGKFMGWPINDRATTIKEYHSYVSLLVKENEAMKASKPSKK